MNFSEIVETIKRLVEIRIKIAVTRITDDLSTIVTRIVMLVLMVLAGMFVLLFGSVALGYFLSVQLGATHLGFLSVAGIYFLIFIILYLVRNTLSLQTSLKTALMKFVFLAKR